MTNPHLSRPLEEFKPRLKPGRMIPLGATFIFELKDTREKLTLPMLMADFILLCGGQFSIREITEKIYRKQGTVAFRALLETLYLLHSRNFLENSHQLRDRPWLSKQQMMQKKLFYDWRLNFMLFSSSHPVAFYLTSLFILTLSLMALTFDWKNPLSEMSLEASLSLIFFAKLYAINSILLTGKYIVRGMQILTLFGRVGDFAIRIAPWGCYFHIEDPQELEKFENRLLTTLFYWSQIFLPFGLLHLNSFSHASLAAWMFTATCFLVFWELNPFRKTEFLKSLLSLMSPDQIDSIAFFDTGLNPRNHKFILACSAFGLLWLAMGVQILTATARAFTGSIVASLLEGSIAERLLALLWIGFWLGGLFFLVHSFVQTSSAIASEQLHYWRLRFAKRFKIPALASKADKKISEQLQNLPLFAHLSEEGLQRLVSSSTLFWAEQGTPIVIAGEESHHLYVLFEGCVCMENGVWSSAILPITIFGESALIEGGLRSATVVARQKSLCLKISVSNLRQITSESHAIGEIESFMTAIMVDQFFASSPLFRKLPREGIDFLSARGKLEFVGADEKIFRQGDPPDFFYMVIRGSLRAEINNKVVKSIAQGGFFGEISLMTNIPRTATVVAEEPSVLFKISIDAFWEVLVQHLEMALFIESIGEQRLIEDMQLMIRTG